jgi:hypothetical protein
MAYNLDMVSGQPNACAAITALEIPFKVVLEA